MIAPPPPSLHVEGAAGRDDVANGIRDAQARRDFDRAVHRHRAAIDAVFKRAKAARDEFNGRPEESTS